MCYELGKLKHIKTEYIEEVLMETVKLRILAEGPPGIERDILKAEERKASLIHPFASSVSRYALGACPASVLSDHPEGRGETMDKHVGWEMSVLWWKLKLGEGITMKGTDAWPQGGSLWSELRTQMGCEGAMQFSGAEGTAKAPRSQRLGHMWQPDVKVSINANCAKFKEAFHLLTLPKKLDIKVPRNPVDQRGYLKGKEGLRSTSW